MTKETKDVEHSSFAVAVVPEFGEDGKWTGSISAHIEEDVHSDLSEDETMQIRTVVAFMATCLPLMESDPEFLDYVKDYYFDNFAPALEELEELQNQPVFTRSDDGKVITLDFNTKTHGSA